MAKQRISNGKYTKEFREATVKLITEGGLSIPEVGRRLSLASSTIAYWVKAHKSGKLSEVCKTHRPLTEVEMENRRLKRELAQARMECDILKKRPRTLRRSRCPVRDDKRDATSIFSAWIKPYAGGINKRILWMGDRPLSKRAQEDARLEAEIRAVDKRTRQTCSPERLQQDMAEHGVEVGVYRIRRIRKKLGMRCKQKKKFKAMTDLNHALLVADNLIRPEVQSNRTQSGVGYRHYLYTDR